MVETIGQYDLVYSPDDGGWYLQLGDAVSQTFPDKEAAITALAKGQIEWE